MSVDHFPVVSIFGSDRRLDVFLITATVASKNILPRFALLLKLLNGALPRLEGC